MESTATLNDELKHLWFVSKTDTKYMFNDLYAQIVFARVGNVKYSDPSKKQFLRILYEEPFMPRLYIDIHDDMVRLTICTFKNGISTEDIEFPFENYEENWFQQSTLHNLYTFDSETMAICIDLAAQFKEHIDNGHGV